MMLKLDFPLCFVTIIMRCVRSACFSIVINGQPLRRLLPSRGICQGHPLSPFLFNIFYVQKACHDAELSNKIHDVKIGKKVDPISHLFFFFFADDSLLFIRANEEEVDQVFEILSTYETTSCQKLNMKKYKMSCSRNIDQEKKQLLQMKLSFKAAEGHEKYLGLLTYIGGSKKVIFQLIQECVLKKLKGCKEGFLSQGGREVLIKAITLAIPTYVMQCFTILVSILNEIKRMCCQFFH